MYRHAAGARGWTRACGTGLIPSAATIQQPAAAPPLTPARGSRSQAITLDGVTEQQFFPLIADNSGQEETHSNMYCPVG